MSHKCNCDHDDVKFCKSCATIYCKSCSKEWVERWLFTYTTPYVYNSPYTVSDGTVVVGNTTTVTPTACGHGV